MPQLENKEIKSTDESQFIKIYFWGRRFGMFGIFLGIVFGFFGFLKPFSSVMFYVGSGILIFIPFTKTLFLAVEYKKNNERRLLNYSIAISCLFVAVAALKIFKVL